MPYREEIKHAGDIPMASSVGGSVNADEMRQALDDGKKVEMEYSSFSDPGDDWGQVRIDGKVLPGSRVKGY